jgi:hypothetical protein
MPRVGEEVRFALVGHLKSSFIAPRLRSGRLVMLARLLRRGEAGPPIARYWRFGERMADASCFDAFARGDRFARAAPSRPARPPDVAVAPFRSAGGEAADPDRPGSPARAAFARLVPLATRWGGNNAYGSLNNVVYYRGSIRR